MLNLAIFNFLEERCHARLRSQYQLLFHLECNLYLFLNRFSSCLWPISIIDCHDNKLSLGEKMKISTKCMLFFLSFYFLNNQIRNLYHLEKLFVCLKNVKLVLLKMKAPKSFFLLVSPLF